MDFKKPKLSAKELVEKMKSKGITFNIINEEDAENYLNIHSNYYRLASYRKVYYKYIGGEKEGQYMNLEFAYLTELSTIDMHFRYLVIKMCLDIEHSLKVKLLSDISANYDEDGYEIVKDFLCNNEWICKKNNK